MNSGSLLWTSRNYILRTNSRQRAYHNTFEDIQVDQDEWDQRSWRRAIIVVGSPKSRGQSLLLQYCHESDTMDEARGDDDSSRGKYRLVCLMGMKLTCNSALLRISHGRNILPKEEGSTGITPRQSRVRGRCQKPTRLLLLKKLLHLLHRM